MASSWILGFQIPLKLVIPQRGFAPKRKRSGSKLPERFETYLASSSRLSRAGNGRDLLRALCRFRVNRRR